MWNRPHNQPRMADFCGRYLHRVFRHSVHPVRASGLVYRQDEGEPTVLSTWFIDTDVDFRCR